MEILHAKRCVRDVLGKVGSLALLLIFTAMPAAAVDVLFVGKWWSGSGFGLNSEKDIPHPTRTTHGFAPYWGYQQAVDGVDVQAGGGFDIAQSVWTQVSHFTRTTGLPPTTLKRIHDINQYNTPGIFRPGQGFGEPAPTPFVYQGAGHEPDPNTHPTIPSTFTFHGTMKATQIRPAKFGGTVQLAGTNDVHVTQVITGGWRTGTIAFPPGPGHTFAVNGGGPITVRETIPGTFMIHTGTPQGPTLATTLNWGFFTLGQWTTGRVQAKMAFGLPFITSRTDTGTFNLNSASTSGMISLVQPGIVQLSNGSAAPLGIATTRMMELTFLPEPSAAIALSSGIGALLLLARAKRKRA